MIDFVLNAFNSFHNRLQFTIEVGGNRISFLDVELINHNNILEFDLYHKPTSSGRFLNFLSLHPLSQKRGIIIGMVDRIFLLSHPKYHLKNLKHLVSILINNDYPLDFIFNSINYRLETLIKKQNVNIKDNSDNLITKQSWFLVTLYSINLCEAFKRVGNLFNAKMAYFGLNKMNKFIRVHKDLLPKEKKRNVVYKISCDSCDATYVGQTGRKLKTRINEHKNHINHNTNSQSVITKHRLEYGHDFKWDSVEVLDSERYLNRRLISECIHIHLQDNGLNKRNDTEGLHHNYKLMLNEMKNNH
ncbi:hypothetical protein ALC62_00564 [Cyphomyrmex costatus]|uniref:GIY-YIG domain-containing protein n=1 Tax=Cyphomyrmex costatus TaxID=456900 RepID=A0A151IQM6_9HYME|nr:hypothetical protein ALC62_00564 [Cyphomyrmex costatus]